MTFFVSVLNVTKIPTRFSYLLESESETSLGRRSGRQAGEWAAGLVHEGGGAGARVDLAQGEWVAGARLITAGLGAGALLGLHARRRPVGAQHQVYGGRGGMRGFIT